METQPIGEDSMNYSQHSRIIALDPGLHGVIALVAMA
jgi:hypothetical protein